MNYYFYHSDPCYTDAFRNYYNKYKSRDISIAFGPCPLDDHVVICDQSNACKFQNHKKVIISETNSTSKNQIKAWQSMEDFYTCLLSQEFVSLDDKRTRVYFFTNAYGGSGSTILSLNFAEMLSEQDQVFYMSLDVLSTYKYYLPQDQRYGFSEVIYKLKSKSLLNLHNHSNLDYFNACDYLEDMMVFNKDLLEELVEHVKEAGYRKIVIDVGRRYEFLSLKDSTIVTVLQTSVLQYECISALNSLFKTDVYLINKRKLDNYISESHLRHIKNYEYINYELELEGGRICMVIEGYTKDLEKTIRSNISQIVLENISSSHMSESQGLLLIQEKVYEQGRQDGLTIDACLELSGTIFDEMFKLGILQKYLDDEDVNEIMINGYQNIHIEKNGEMIFTNEAFESEEALNSIIQSMVSKINRRVNQSNPIVDARLEDGSRIHIVLNPVAINGPILTIRKFRNDVYTLDHMFASKIIDDELYGFLKSVIRSKYNIFISGGTSSGKTTFLNALSHYIPKDERIITIEDSAELSLGHIKNLVRLETKASNAEGQGAIDMAHLIKASLRMRPDRIIVGEVRGKEALDMIHAMSTGHDGSLSTGHGNSCKDMLKRLELMILKGVDLPTKVISKLIGSSIDLIIHLERSFEGQRFIREIFEIVEAENGYTLNPLYLRENETLLKINPLINKEKVKRYER